MKITMTSIHVEDPHEAFTFYTETLGFEEHTYLPEADLAIVVSPEDPDGTALLLEPSENPVASDYMEGLYDQNLPVIVFGVDDIGQQYKELKEKGVEFTKAPTKTDWGYEAFFEDTCGNLIQLFQM